MADQPQIEGHTFGLRTFSRLAKIGLISFALFGAMFVGTSEGVASTDTPMPAPSASQDKDQVGIEASCYCYNRVNHGHNWTGYCQVCSGYIRTITSCTDPAYNSVGAWIDPRSQPWFVYGDCRPSHVM